MSWRRFTEVRLPLLGLISTERQWSVLWGTKRTHFLCSLWPCIQSDFVHNAKNPEYLSAHETDKMGGGWWRGKKGTLGY